MHPVGRFEATGVILNLTASSTAPLADLDAVAIDIDLVQLADLAGTQEMLLELGIID